MIQNYLKNHLISAILISVTIDWITVGYKAVKAAVANPVKSLRSE